MDIRFARKAHGRAAARALSLAVLLVVPAAWLAGCEEANEAPAASFTAAPGAGHRSLEVAFDATASSDADGEIAGYSWDFGDGGTATGAEASHAYAAAGAYKATLTVTDDRGATDTRALTVAVEEPVYPPILTSIEPADGAVVRGAEAWVRWRPSVPATGRVLWRRSGDEAFQSADAGVGDALLARLGPLETGRVYEYIVEESTEALVLRSGLRTFTVEGGIGFDPPSVEQTVKRDYDQSVALTLRNDSDEAVVVAARALAQFDDLPADVVGPGSVDEPAELAPGKSLALRLAVFAPDATRDSYDIPIEAAGAFALVRVRIDHTVFKLSWRVVEEDPNTLAKTIEIRNEGSTLSDLALRIAAPSDAAVRLDPDTKHAYLRAGRTLRLVATPVLYLEFEALDAEIEATAAGQSVRFPLAFRRPPDKRLVGIRSGTSHSSSSSDYYCTNKPNTCSTLSGPKGTGPVLPADMAGTGAAGLDERWTPETPNGGDADSSFARNLGEEWSPSPYDFNLAGSEPRPRVVLAGLGDAGAVLAQATATAPSDGTEDGDSLQAGVKSLPQDMWGEIYTEGERPDGLVFVEPKIDVPRDPKVMIVLTPGQRNYYYYPPDPPISKSCELRCGKCFANAKYLSDLYDGIYEANKRVGKKKVLFRRVYPISDALEPILRELEKLYSEVREICRNKGCPLPLPFFDNGQLTAPDLSPPGDQLFPDAAKEWFNETAKMHTNNARDLRDISFIEYMNIYEPIANALDETAEVYREIYKDPPSDEYQEVVSPVVEPISDLMSGSDLDRLGWATVLALRWERTYLDAYLTSMERYRGAAAAQSDIDMARQADAMVRFSQLALNAAQTATKRRYWLGHFASEALDQTLGDSEQRNITWSDLLAQAHEQFKTEELPGRIRKNLIAAGYSDEDIQAYRDRILSLSPQRVAEAIENVEVRLNADRLVGEGLATKRSRVDWPIPPDAHALQILERIARGLVEKVSARNPASRTHSPNSTGTTDVFPRLRPGLLEALQRRASFTRAHRGPFAAPMEGDAGDSTAQAAGWHGGERVVFAWHQQGDRVVFAAFDPQGGVVEPPQVIGTGRWPRLTAAGGRTAVAWERGGGFVVRVHDGDAWGEEVGLDGGEAALAFAPNGALHAATTTGLWTLADGRFERLREAAYSQPAIALDGDGQPHVAWRRDGRVMYDDAEVGRGERPTLAFASDGAARLAYLSDGALVVRARRDGEWTPPRTIPAENPSWPALASGGGAVRLTYLGAAEHGPDALWLVRLPDPEPLLVPSLAGNVTDAWFTIKFGLNTPRSYYRPHDVLVTVNDVWVKLFSNTVPDGRHLFRLNPYHVFTSTGRPVPNRVAIFSWHMNGGQYTVNSEYQLIVRTAWSEHFALVSSDRAALDAIGDPRANHDMPDLVLLANAIELPVKRPEPGTIELPVTVANLGEARSRPARLLMHANGQTLGAADVVALEPGELKTIPMTLRYDGRLENVTFRLEQDDPDLDPANDSLTLTLWGAEVRPRPVALAGSDKVGDAVAGDPGAGIRLDIAGAADTLYRWEVVEAQAPDEVVAQNPGSEKTIRVPPGEYRVAITPTLSYSRRLVWPGTVRVTDGEVATVAPDSGIRLELPEEMEPIYQWQVVAAGRPDEVVQEYWDGGAKKRTMLVPPGEYQVAITPTWSYSRRLVWPGTIEVGEGGLTTARLDSGVRIVSSNGAGSKLDVRLLDAETRETVQWARGSVPFLLLVPAGTYIVETRPPGQGEWRVLADAVRVEPHRVSTVE